jgi:trk system potassium uptake protein TrkA
MYIVIVGAGDIGRPLIETATRGGNEVVVIENHEERADFAASEFDAMVLHDDATVKDTLEDAGIQQADALVSTTDQDATNVMVCLLARELEVPRIVSVVHNPEHMALFERIGVNVMQNPQRLIAESLYRAVKRPSIVDYMRIGEEAEVFEIEVGAEAPITNKTLQEANEAGLFGTEVLVVAIERDDSAEPITPRGGTVIQHGDRVTVYSAHGATPDVTDIFGHYEDQN